MPDIDIIPSSEVKLQRPAMWTCVFINDEYTSMQFVVQILIEVFNQSPPDALSIMLRVHHEGKAPVGSYPKDIAHIKTDQTLAAAVAHQYPLQVIPTAL